MLTGIFAYLILQSNIWIFAAVGTSKDVALFAVANRLVVTMGVISVMVSSVYLPRISAMFANGDMASLRKMARTVATASTVMALIPAAALIISPELILKILFGQNYVESAFYARVMAIGFLFNSLSGMRGQILIMSGNERTQAFISMVAGLVTIVATYITAVKFGVKAGLVMSTSLMVLTGFIEMATLRLRTGILCFVFGATDHVESAT